MLSEADRKGISDPQETKQTIAADLKRCGPTFAGNFKWKSPMPEVFFQRRGIGSTSACSG
ncbi:MAG: hypothetical protein ACOC98_07955 [Thermodesulfobacteriota bacterium]